LKCEVGVSLGDAHGRFDAKDVPGKTTLPDQQLHVLAVLPKSDDVKARIKKTFIT
jgi:hypothetical protein